MTVTAADIQRTIKAITAPGEFAEIEERAIGGRTYRVFKQAAATVTDMLQRARGYGDAEFLVYEGQRVTYQQFFERVDALAAALQNNFGVRKGDRVAIAMRNSPDWMVAFTAAIFVGAVVVPVNSWGKTEELHFAITQCGAKCAVVDFARYNLIAQLIESMGIDVLVSEVDTLPAQNRVQRLDAVIAQGKNLSYDVINAEPEEDCLILYTSGSTGFPKGATHRHIGVCQAVMNMFYIGILLMNLEGPRAFKGGATKDTPMLSVPLFHASGLMSGFLVPIQAGQKVVVMPKWDCLKALQLTESEKVTILSSVPAILKDFLSHPEFDRYDTSTLIRVSAGGAATPTGLPELIEQKLGAISRSAGYGMTETLAVTATMAGVIFDLKPLSCGPLSPIMQLRFVDAANNEVPSGEQGEIQMYSIVCTTGYWEKPEANKEAFTADGWLKTGDIGYIDADGFLHVTGRIKEIVIRGGENIYPVEIEQAAYKHSAVKEVVVFGVDDTAMGEELGMVCYRQEGIDLTENELRDYLRERLAGYKVPKFIAFSPEPLPRNASEKLHKINVRENFIAGLYASSRS